MSKQMKDYQQEMMSVLFNWRQGFDAATQENVLQAENEFGQFFILWQDEDEYTVVVNRDTTGGDDFDNLEDAKAFCVQFVRGIIMRNLMTYYVMGVVRGDQMKAGAWNQEQLIAFIHDQFFNQYNPIQPSEIQMLIDNMREESELNGHCECERCQSIFGEEEDDGYLPGDPEAMPDIQDDAAVKRAHLKLTLGGDDDGFAPVVGNTKKPTIH